MAEPRSLEQRLADTRARLARDVDAWVASAGVDRPWLVPLSFVYADGELLFATDAESGTVTNLAHSSVVRIALGETRDVVLIDGIVTVEPIASMTEAQAARYVDLNAGSDPREWADSLLRLRPRKVQAWREENELRGRHLMIDGRWLDE